MKRGLNKLLVSLVLVVALLPLLAWGQAAGVEKIAFVTRDEATRTLTLQVVNPDGTGMTPLVVSDNIAFPAWSPDGSQLAFSANRSGSQYFNIYVMNSDGSNLRIVSEHRCTQCASVPAWSPDGTQILYAIFFSGGYSDLYRVNVDGSGEEKLRLEGMSNQLWDTWVGWSPDGSQIAAVAQDDETIRISSGRVYVADADGSSPQPFPAVSDSGMAFHFLDWSPDGQRVILSWASGTLLPDGQERLSLANADRSSVQPIATSPPANLSSPSWSPDSSRIVYIANDAVFRAPGDLWIINADGSNRHRLNIAGDVVQYGGTSWGVIPADTVFPSAPLTLDAIG